MHSYVTNIERDTIANDDFRRVLFTGPNTQLVALEDGSAVVIPAGVEHNVVNTSGAPLRLYTLYSPPEHPDGTVHRTKQEADAEHH